MATKTFHLPFIIPICIAVLSACGGGSGAEPLASEGTTVSTAAGAAIPHAATGTGGVSGSGAGSANVQPSGTGSGDISTSNSQSASAGPGRNVSVSTSASATAPDLP